MDNSWRVGCCLACLLFLPRILLAVLQGPEDSPTPTAETNGLGPVSSCTTLGTRTRGAAQPTKAHHQAFLGRPKSLEGHICITASPLFRHTFALNALPATLIPDENHKMDPISIAASIITVVQMADRVISLCRFYLELSRDAPPDLRVIMIETSALRTILDNIQFLASKGHAPANLHTLTGDGAPVEGCHKALDQLSQLFSSEYAHDAVGNRSKRRKVKATLATLAWPFKESTARKLLEEVVQHKTTLNLALTADIR